MTTLPPGPSLWAACRGLDWPSSFSHPVNLNVSDISLLGTMSPSSYLDPSQQMQSPAPDHIHLHPPPQHAFRIPAFCWGRQFSGLFLQSCLSMCEPFPAPSPLSPPCAAPQFEPSKCAHPPTLPFRPPLWPAQPNAPFHFARMPPSRTLLWGRHVPIHPHPKVLCKCLRRLIPLSPLMRAPTLRRPTIRPPTATWAPSARFPFRLTPKPCPVSVSSKCKRRFAVECSRKY